MLYVTIVKYKEGTNGIHDSRTWSLNFEMKCRGRVGAKI